MVLYFGVAGWEGETMKILAHIKDWVVRQRRNKLADYLWQSRKLDNRGLLWQLLVSMPCVEHVTMESGGLRMGYVNITMSDGYEITVTGLFASDILQRGIVKVVDRLKEVWGVGRRIRGSAHDKDR
jgi:hypothetical protein